LEEADHLVVCIGCDIIGGKGTVCDHESMRFSLVYLELVVVPCNIQMPAWSPFMKPVKKTRVQIYPGNLEKPRCIEKMGQVF